jgi:hypothetical protein
MIISVPTNLPIVLFRALWGPILPATSVNGGLRFARSSMLISLDHAALLPKYLVTLARRPLLTGCAEKKTQKPYSFHLRLRVSSILGEIAVPTAG